jgi:probable F420-dependent oxidoreductase
MNAVIDQTRHRLGPAGIWLGGIERVSDRWLQEKAALTQLDNLTVYGSLWTGEVLSGKDIFAHLGLWLAATSRMIVGAGIANVWGRQPEVTQAAGATLAEAYPDRFIQGVGIGHAFQAVAAGGHFRSPLTTMRDYLDRMDAEASRTPFAAPPFARVIAAVGPRMLDLAKEKADGAHPYFVPVEHTADARARLGPTPLLIPEQAVLVDPDERALEAFRTRLGQRAHIPTYRANLLRYGLTEHDLDTVSDRFFTAVAVAGAPEQVAARVVAHRDAGADHVLVSPFGDLRSAVEQLHRLAPALRRLQ